MQSPASNLDAARDQQTQQHTEVLLEAFANDGDVLWDNYGIDEDILVGHSTNTHLWLC